MRTLTRYVLAEFLRVLLVSLLGMTILILLVLIGREAVDQGLGVWPILRLIPYAFPVAMRFAVPGTVLLAATAVYGRMAGSNEVVAVKSSGISPLAIIWPLLVLTALISLGAVWLNDLAVSWGQRGVNRVILESAEATAYSTLKTRKTFSSKGLTISVLRVEGARLIKPTFVLKQSDAQAGGTIRADEAQLRVDTEDGELVIELFNARVDVGENRGIWPGTVQYVVPLRDFVGRKQSMQRPSEIPLSGIQEAIVRQQQKIARQHQSMAVRAASCLATGNFAALADRRWQNGQRGLATARGTLCRLRTEPHRRWANGLSCLCFAMVGIPMAIRRRHGEFLASFFACFLPILVVYYPFLMVSVDHAKEGKWLPASVWLGNLVLVVWGIWLMRKVIRY